MTPDLRYAGVSRLDFCLAQDRIASAFRLSRLTLGGQFIQLLIGEVPRADSDVSVSCSHAAAT